MQKPPPDLTPEQGGMPQVTTITVQPSFPGPPSY